MLSRRAAALRHQVAKLARAFDDARFDLLHGVDTGGYIRREELALDRSSHDYLASPRRKVVAALRALPVDLRHFTFVDMGCGKGRVLLIARKFQFRQVIGVELSEKLYRTAVRNTRRFPDVSVVHGDAAHYPMPAGPCVLFLFNPFSENVLESVTTNIERRFTQDASPVYVIYLSPEFQAPFETRQRFRRLPYKSRNVNIYVAEA